MAEHNKGKNTDTAVDLGFIGEVVSTFIPGARKVIEAKKKRKKDLEKAGK